MFLTFGRFKLLELLKLGSHCRLLSIDFGSHRQTDKNRQVWTKKSGVYKSMASLSMTSNWSRTCSTFCRFLSTDRSHARCLLVRAEPRDKTRTDNDMARWLEISSAWSSCLKQTESGPCGLQRSWLQETCFRQDRSGSIHADNLPVQSTTTVFRPDQRDLPLILCTNI